MEPWFPLKAQPYRLAHTAVANALCLVELALELVASNSCLTMVAGVGSVAL